MFARVSVDCWQNHHRFNPDLSIGENPVNPLGKFAQNDIFCTGQAIKIPFVINEFHEHCSLLLYWMDMQYLCCVFIRYSREGVNMGFPSPAADYVEKRISLDQQLISQPSATYFMRAARSHFREGII
ncbi:gp26 domain protein [Escherichia coli 2864350]|nr:gp26 domain protein [Escherichia coli 2864350]